MVVLLGIDVHKATHTAVAVDEGRAEDRAVRGGGHRWWSSTAAGVGIESVIGCGSRWRIVGRYRRGWSGRCWVPGRRWCGCRRS